MTMTENDISLIKKQWEIGVPIKQIVRNMPCSKGDAMKHLLKLQRDGVLPKRERKSGSVIVVAAYKSGMHNPYEIAETYGYKVGTVRNWLTKAKLSRGRPKHNWKEKPQSEKTKKILQCIENGMRSCDIAREFGVTKQWVSYLKTRSERDGQ